MTEPSKANRNLYIYAGVAALLLVMWVQLTLSVHGESISWDEGDHLFAGYMSVKTGDLGLNPEHPPLVKMVAALPLLAMHDLRVPPLQNRNFKWKPSWTVRNSTRGTGRRATSFVHAWR